MEKIVTKQMSMEKFIDIYDFLDTINDRARRNAINRRWADANCFNSVKGATSHEVEDKNKRKKFFGTETYEQSVELMESGWNEGVSLIENAGCAMQGRKGLHFHTDIIGMTPCIPNAIMGLPDSMMNMTLCEGNQKQIRLVYGIEASSKVSAKEMAGAARKLLDVVATIESRGIKCELDIAYLVRSKETGQYIATMFSLKKADQKLNLKLVAYPMVHPSFMRRQLFLWCETISFDLENFDRHDLKVYGYPVRSSDTAKTLLRDAKVLDDRDIFINTYDIMDECESASDVMRVMSYQNKLFSDKRFYN